MKINPHKYHGQKFHIIHSDAIYDARHGVLRLDSDWKRRIMTPHNFVYDQKAPRRNGALTLASPAIFFARCALSSYKASQGNTYWLRNGRISFRSSTRHIRSNTNRTKPSTRFARENRTERGKFPRRKYRRKTSGFGKLAVNPRAPLVLPCSA